MLIVTNKPFMLSVNMLNAVIMSVVMLRDAMLSVVAPTSTLYTISHFNPSLI
jgi:hypothetical protein